MILSVVLLVIVLYIIYDLYFPKTVKIRYVNDVDWEIKKVKHGDWIDLYVNEDVKLKKGEFKLINLGINVILPKGYELNIVPRSSTFKHFGVIQTNHFGVIDNTYCGNDDIIYFPAYALCDTEIKKGERICQARINKVQRVRIKFVDKACDKNRGGIGSTGR